MMARLSPVVDGEVSDEARAVLGRMAERGHGASLLYLTLAHAPRVLDAWTGLSWTLREDLQLPASLRELAVLRVAQLQNASYQWTHHVDAARSTGVTEAQLAALGGWQTSDVFDDPERTVLALADAVVGDTVSDVLFAEVASRFSTTETVELAVTIAFYVAVARLLHVLGLEGDLPPGQVRVPTHL